MTLGDGHAYREGRVVTVRPAERVRSFQVAGKSRGAISALSRPINEPLHVALARAAEEVAARHGARLELDIDPGVSLAPDTVAIGAR